MKRLFLLLCVATMAFSCDMTPTAKITFTNTTDVNRSEEMVEICLDAVNADLELKESAPLVVYNPKGEEIPSQITYDGKLIFQVDVAASSKATYKVKVGEPQQYEAKVFGRKYPERMDDFAWENDRIAYRVYGPASQAADQNLYGNDVWTKSVPDLILDYRYAMDLDPVMRAKINELAKTDKEAAAAMLRSISFHVNHENGMDDYNVGPTLGAGGLALMEKGIVYPYCYENYEILDKGPLRFTFKLTYTPLTVGGRDDVIETRTNTMDAGTYFVRTAVSYSNLEKKTPVVAGIVMMNERSKVYKISKEKKYATYADDDRRKEGNGKIFVGTIFVEPVKSAGVMPFASDNPIIKSAGMTGHAAIIGDYTPGTEFVYYWGAEWELARINKFEDWVSHVEDMSAVYNTPLEFEIK